MLHLDYKIRLKTKNSGEISPEFFCFKQINTMKKILPILTITILLFSCGGGEENNNYVDGYDRQILLTNLTDNIIIPAYENFHNKVTDLENATTLFSTQTDQTNYDLVRQKWFDAYKAWQHVEMFDINLAEEINFRKKINSYPCNTARIELNVLNGGYDFNNPNHYAAQGFPTLDYMINGLANGLSDYTGTNGNMYLSYLQDVVLDLKTNTTNIKNDWISNRNEFVLSTANTATSSLNKLTNDFIFYYEKGLRANKIGIPVGIFSGSALPENVECYYYNLETGNASKILLMEAFDGVVKAFNGISFDGNNDGEGWDNYLQFLNALNNGVNLDVDLNETFGMAIDALENLDDDLMNQIIIDELEVRAAYDKVQMGTVLLKTDMLGYLNIDVDYLDADGD